MALAQLVRPCSLFRGCRQNVLAQFVAGITHYQLPPVPRNIKFPPGGRKLPELPKTPEFNTELGERAWKTRLQLDLIRGPELVHNEFIHKQYGVVAIHGGMLGHHHLETIRKMINNKLSKNQFAVWRVDAPWLSRTRPTRAGKGGGKGPIHHYMTPVKAGRVIVEVGGDICYAEARQMLGPVAHCIPMPAKAYSWDEMLAIEAKKKSIQESNVNPYTWEYIMRWNMQNCAAWLSPHDYLWGGHYR